MYGATTPASTATTPEQYWNSLSATQQSYLNKLVLKKNVAILIGVAALGAALTFVAAKKKLI
jgi:hypothetical protein